MNAREWTGPVHAAWQAPWPSVLLRNWWLILTFERSRAQSPVAALRAFLAALPAELGRLRRLGFRQYLELCRLELVCADVGLGYKTSSSQDGPPWRLPANFTTAPVDELPPHPVIDAQILKVLIRSQLGPEATAIAALSDLLKHGGLLGRRLALSSAEGNATSSAGNARVAVCLHLFYPEFWTELNAALTAIPEPWDLFVTAPYFACNHTLEQVVRDRPDVRFFPCINRGRDVLPFVSLISNGMFGGYDVVCKLHSKRSAHMIHGDRWRETALAALLGEPSRISQLLGRFRNESDLGLVGPNELRVDPGHPLHHGQNLAVVRTLAKRFQLSAEATERPFFAGTMFWVRPAALSRLRSLLITERDFPREMGQTDGTLAHAIERLMWPLAEATGYRVCGLDVPERTARQ